MASLTNDGDNFGSDLSVHQHHKLAQTSRNLRPALEGCFYLLQVCAFKVLTVNRSARIQLDGENLHWYVSD